MGWRVLDPFGVWRATCVRSDSVVDGGWRVAVLRVYLGERCGLGNDLALLGSMVRNTIVPIGVRARTALGKTAVGVQVLEQGKAV